MSDYDPTFATKRRVKAVPPEQCDVAIIGAGLGGLMSGARLAKAGLQVAIFDQHYVAGGCCTMFSRGGPRHRRNFDIGLHYIGDCAPGGQIPELLDEVGIKLDYVPLDPDGFDTLVFPELTFPIPVGWDAYRDRLIEHFPREKRGIDRYVRFLREIEFMQNAMARHKPGLRLAWEAISHARLAGRYVNGTLADILDTCTTNPLLRAVIAGQSGDYGLPPSQVSAALHAGLVNHYFKGAYYPRGGGQTIADQLAQTVEDHGGSVHLRRGIDRIMTENGHAIGVRTEVYKGAQYEVRAKRVISNADIHLTLDRLIAPEDLSDTWKQRSENMHMAAALFISCLNIKGSMRDRGMRNANYWQFDGTDMETFYKARDLQPRGCYITAATMKDPDTPHHAPEGEDSVEVMTVLPGDAQSWGVDVNGVENWKYKKSSQYQETKQRIEDDLIRRLDNLFPGSAENITFRESATPMSHTRFTRATDGTGYGLACTPDQFMQKRPGYRGPIDGLYFAGASTRAGHGVLGSLLSGKACAKAVLRDAG